MAYKESKPYVGLYPALPETGVDDELEKVLQESLITAQEDERKRIAARINNSTLQPPSAYARATSPRSQGSPLPSAVFTNIHTNINRTSGSSQTNGNRTSGNIPDFPIQPKTIASLADKPSSVSTETNSFKSTNIARPRPSGIRDVSEVDCNTFPRPKPPVPKPPGVPKLSADKFGGMSATGVGSQRSKTLERISSDDPELIALPPRPAVNTKLTTVLRSQSVPPPYTDEEGKGAELSLPVDIDGSLDVDRPLICLSPLKQSWMDFDVSLFDPCRPDNYQPPPPSIPPKNRQLTQSSLSGKNNQLPPSLPVKTLKQSSTLPSNSVPSTNAVNKMNTTMPSQAYGLRGISGQPWPMPMPMPMPSVIPPAGHSQLTALVPVTVYDVYPMLQSADWCSSSLPAIGWNEAVVGDLSGFQTTPTLPRSPFNDLMEFAECQWDPQYMSLEDFDPLYNIVPTRQTRERRSDSIDLFPSNFMEFGFGTSKYPAASASDGRVAASTTLALDLPHSPAASSTGAVASPPSYFYSADLPYAEDSELQDPFSFQDLTLSLEKKRQQHAQEQLARDERLAREARLNPAPVLLVESTSPAAGSVLAARSNLSPIQRRLGQYVIKYTSLAQVAFNQF